jgi:soluble cytochrome b562
LKDFNKGILGILKKVAKNTNIRKTKTWTESKKEMISILTKKIQKIKEDQHFRDVDVNDFHMGIHSLVSLLSS